MIRELLISRIGKKASFEKTMFFPNTVPAGRRPGVHIILVAWSISNNRLVQEMKQRRNVLFDGIFIEVTTCTALRLRTCKPQS